MASALTLGAEEELHLIDTTTWQLSARAPQVLSRLPREGYSAEIQRTTVETNTAVVETLDGLRAELLRLRAQVVAVAAKEGLGVAAVGTAPRSASPDFELTATGRYGRMQEQYRLLVDEQLICGTQVHVGVADRDLAVDIAQRVAPDLPVMLALSASSPYWNGHDTGYSSIRTTIWQRWPTAGATGPMGSAAEYDALLADLIGSGVIADAKMAYFDVRPSAHAPTLELRVCDACPLVDDAVLIAGLFRALVREAEIAVERGEPRRDRPAPLHRAALWQAARGGLRGRLLDPSEHPRPLPAAEVVRALVDRLQPVLADLGDAEQVRELAERALVRGNSADRQRAAFAETGQLDDVVRLVVAETHGPAGGVPQTGPVLSGYAVRAGDEAVAPSAQVRPQYRGVLEAVRALGPDALRQREQARDAWAERAQLGFRVGGEVRPFGVDLVPRVLGRHEWAELRAGLEQRAVALERFLRDVYGEQRVLADGVLPREAVVGAPGWREEGLRLPASAVRAAVVGFDVVRGEDGGWRVLEDNLRDPSGAAYACAARELLDDVLPEAPRPDGLAAPAAYYERLRATLLAGARPGTRAALLSSGPASGAWFEHQGLASGAGLLLVGADDLAVVDGRVVATGASAEGAPLVGGTRTGRPEQVGVLYLRLDGPLAEVRASDGRPVGAELLDAAAAGAVVLANAPGNGVADDKAVYRAVPELISYYLGERPLLEQVPTYLVADEGERRAVLERVGELVTKPVDGHGGAGVLIGPTADAGQVAARRAEIGAHPERWVAQELVQLSSLPALVGGALVPRHVDLRVFAHVVGDGRDDARVADLALTRVAPAGSVVVNSSRGGGAKDTWIVVGDAPKETPA
ncbi:carboxylate--amine ligase/circularly permuted type 2 ATP-grasp protein [Quadrisphaera sp. INWT6]|uniref:carboxylate--amine ligase/circularly permuted type 2 ATP-grasp protein n=1 Tax=Quadrisphaera sp. INWT6 TaxID=2596917 RepID=UPI00189267F7|nr:carboxylate--amine ligase/circularly permuted type 2 ATP-grasp protein [Quadrisphaera sp. INWT6]